MPVRGRLAAALLAAALALAAWLWPQRPLVAEHLAAWQASAPPVAMRYAALSPAMDEADLQRHFAGLAWRCTGQPAARLCEAAMTRADGVPAAGLRAAFQRGRLQSLALRLPWWRHHQMARTLVQTLGAPDAATPGTGEQAPSIAWQLPGGQLDLPRAPGLQPLRWTELRWRSTAAR